MGKKKRFLLVVNFHVGLKCLNPCRRAVKSSFRDITSVMAVHANANPNPNPAFRNQFTKTAAAENKVMSGKQKLAERKG